MGQVVSFLSFSRAVRAAAEPRLSVKWWKTITGAIGLAAVGGEGVSNLEVCTLQSGETA